MNTSADILAIIEKNKATLYRKYPIKSIGIFGSYAREEQNASSDIDIIVDFHDSIGIRFIDLADEIEALLNCKVDLVSRKGVKEKYLQLIEQEVIYV